MGIVSILHAEKEKLSRKQQKIANYILENIETACFLSLRDLAEQAGTTEVTVINFAKNLGFKNFLDLKKELQSYMRDRLSPDERVKAAISMVFNKPETCQRFLDQEMQNLVVTFEAIRYENLQFAASLLNGTRRIYLASHAVSEVVALLMEYRMRHLGYFVENVAITDLQAASRSIAMSEDEDIFILITFPPYCPETVALAGYLKSLGKKFIAITDSPQAPVAEGSQVVLSCANDDSVFYNSITSAIVIVNMVCSLLAIDIRDKFDEFVDKFTETSRMLESALEQQNLIDNTVGGETKDVQLPQ